MTGKVAVITGASEGIGAGLVDGYRDRGWAVVASARTIKPAEDPGVFAVEGDIADPASAGRVIGGALDRFGRIDTLVNNAGVVISKPFTDYTAADYALVVGVSLAGFFWLTQRAIAEMASRYGGHVVNVSVTLAEAASPGAPAVLAALTRGGLAAATRSLAVEYAAYGIRVNAVRPGIIAAAPAQCAQAAASPCPPAAACSMAVSIAADASASRPCRAWSRSKVKGAMRLPVAAATLSVSAMIEEEPAKSPIHVLAIPNWERWSGSSAIAPASRASWTCLAEIALMPSTSHTRALAPAATEPHRRTSSTGMPASALAARRNAGVAAAWPSVPSSARPSSSRSRGRGSPCGGGRAWAARQISTRTPAPARCPAMPAARQAVR